MLLAGLVLAVLRRLLTRSRLKTTIGDVVPLVLVGAMVGSGFLLEGVKIVSRSDFYRMVEEFHDLEATEEVAALEALWVTEYGLAAAKSGLAYTEELLEQGRSLNEEACIDCHARPQWAAASYALSRLLTPLGRDRQGGAVSFTYWLHVCLAFGLLAWLPFGKMRHVVTSPLNCLVDRLKQPLPQAASSAVKRRLALDACTHCGLCSENCSVGLCAEQFHNRLILPSEKLAILGKTRSEAESRPLLEGLTVCTDCLRCTGICPVGIDLQDLWDAVREDLLAEGRIDAYALSPLGLHRSETFPAAFTDTQPQLEGYRQQSFAAAGSKTVHDTGEFGGLLRFTADNGAFNLCFECKTCTNSCPIIGLKNLDELGLAPHQIIHATALGLDELVASARMLWACLGCYRCQEACPQGVRVTEVLYLHKNKAIARLKEGSFRKEGAA